MAVKMGRPVKPDMTQEEHEATRGMGNRKAAAKVSEMRGANVASISQVAASKRRVSHDWIRVQRQKSGAAEKSQIAGSATPTENPPDTSHTGPRMGYVGPGGKTGPSIEVQPNDPCPECCEADGNVLCDVAYCTHGCHKPVSA